MSDPAGAPAPADHNQPPLKDRLAIDYENAIAALNALVARANEMPQQITTDEQDAMVSVVIADAAQAAREAEDARKKEGRPFLDATQEVNDFFRPIVTRADQIKAQLLLRLTDYKNQKRQAEIDRQRKIADEARAAAAATLAAAAAAETAASPVQANTTLDRALAHQQRAVDADHAAAAPVADMTRVRAGGGVTSSARVQWDFRITDLDGIDVVALRPFFARADIEKAIRAYVARHKGDKPLAGVEIFDSLQAKVGRR